MKRLFTSAILSLVLLTTAMLAGGRVRAADRTADAVQGVVVSVSSPASEVGLAVLQDGGNAVDAAVATAFALAVTWPAAGNIGGGGFMMVAPGKGQPPVCIEYRETAPAAAHARTLEKYSRLDGHLVAGTPGTVAGLALAHRTYGQRPWRELVMPAVRLAREGVVVNAALASSLNSALRSPREFAELQRVFAPPDGKEWHAGDRLVQAELADTLERIATEGPQGFYDGTIADLIVAEMQAGGGLIAKQDLAGYKAHVREPIHGTYRGYDVYGPPPPSSGGICLVEMLNILENFELAEASTRPASGRREPVEGAGADAPGSPTWTPQTMHLMVEAMRRLAAGHSERVAGRRHSAGRRIAGDYAFLGDRPGRHGGGQHLHARELIRLPRGCARNWVSAQQRDDRLQPHSRPHRP
jgi:gamma-glutamyltranspeptidase/glutathione hydrolase